jgi:TatD DNase family protein
MKYFDAHCHIQFDAYDADRDEVIARMEEVEVGGLVVGCDRASSLAAVDLVQNRPELFTAVGLHPNDTAKETDGPFDPGAFEDMLRQPGNKIVAIGECGLDYYRMQQGKEEFPNSSFPKQMKGASSAYYRPDEPEAVKKRQKEVFDQHIELAVKYNKPLMIHSRPSKGTQDAYHDTLDMLRSKQREYGDRLRGNMHFFVGGIDEARAFVDLDFTLSYTAVITFARDYDDVIRSIPLTHLLTETDSPYVAPAPNRGRRNEPTAVRDVVRALAQIRSESEESVRVAILNNSARVFDF